MLLNRGVIFVPEVNKRKILTHKPSAKTKSIVNTPLLGSKSSHGPRFELESLSGICRYPPCHISAIPTAIFGFFVFFEKIHIEATMVQI